MKYGRIENSFVVEVCESNPRALFNDSYAAQFGEVQDEVQSGWISGEDGAFSAPPTPVADPREEFKRARTEAVSRIKVTTAAGNTFDGDEESQTRMSRAVVGMGFVPAGTTILYRQVTGF